MVCLSTVTPPPNRRKNMNDEKMAEANKWLNNALKYEAEGKSQKFIDMALDKACKLEKEALAS